MKPLRAVTERELARLVRGELSAYIIGSYMYKGETGIGYETAFFRKLNPATMCFEPVESSDYEYED